LCVQTGLYIFLALVALYVTFVFWLVQTKRLEKWNLSLMLGIILMVRTQRGTGTIDFIARPKRFWNLIGDLGIVVTLGGMLLITIFFLWSVWFVLQPDSGVPALGPTEIFVIPGLTPGIPLLYGLLALIVTLVVHEGGHGVLARANGMKLKSIGVLMLIVPIGAFVEPDDLDLKVASRRQRLRVFAAGPAVNFGVAALTLAGFALMMGSLAPIPGVAVAGVTAGGPAEHAGIPPASVILDVRHVGGDWQRTPDWTTLVTFLRASHPGDHVALFFSDESVRNATLASFWDSLPGPDRDAVTQGTEAGMQLCKARFADDPQGVPATGGECADRMRAQAFLGMRPLLPDDTAFLAHPLGDSGKNLASLFSLPIAEVQGHAPVLTVYLPAFYATPFSSQIFWPIAYILFWVFWINFAVGLTNILPMLPLDGGHIFRDAVGGVYAKLGPGLPTEKREKMVARTATAVSLLILGAFLLEIFGPHLMNLWR